MCSSWAAASAPGTIAVLEDALELGEVVGDREDEQLLLGGELPVDQPARDADGARDLLDRRVEHAALVEQRAGRRDQVALPFPAPRARIDGGHPVPA